MKMVFKGHLIGHFKFINNVSIEKYAYSLQIY